MPEPTEAAQPHAQEASGVKPMPAETYTPPEKHLEFIQAAIGRMAGNSFLLKGWAVTLVTALFGFNLEQLTFRIWASAGGVILLFWGLDAYYLYLEQAFRKLYAGAIKGVVHVDGKDVPIERYSMNIESYRGWETFKNAVSSVAVWPLYASLAVATSMLVYFSPQPTADEKPVVVECVVSPTSAHQSSAQAVPTQTPALSLPTSPAASSSTIPADVPAAGSAPLSATPTNTSSTMAASSEPARAQAPTAAGGSGSSAPPTAPPHTQTPASPPSSPASKESPGPDR